MAPEEWKKLTEDAIKNGIREGIKTQLTSGYSSPLEKLIKEVVDQNAGVIKAMLLEVFGSITKDDEFKKDIITQTRHILAKVLIQRFGGEIEKSVNVLKSDPRTRAEITLAISKIVSGEG